jgi:hypothetical protein
MRSLGFPNFAANTSTTGSTTTTSSSTTGGNTTTSSETRPLAGGLGNLFASGQAPTNQNTSNYFAQMLNMMSNNTIVSSTKNRYDCLQSYIFHYIRASHQNSALLPNSSNWPTWGSLIAKQIYKHLRQPWAMLTRPLIVCLINNHSCRFRVNLHFFFWENINLLFFYMLFDFNLNVQKYIILKAREQPRMEELFYPLFSSLGILYSSKLLQSSFVSFSKKRWEILKLAFFKNNSGRFYIKKKKDF